MIKGIGIDIIEIKRIKKLIGIDNKFIEKIFTPKEIDYCKNKVRKEQHYGARFAAKESFLKALGTGLRSGMSWKDVSIKNDKLGKPKIELHGKTLEKFNNMKCKQIHLSISHTKEYAIAYVIIE